MGLVNELQEAAEQEDVLTVLRKTKRLSSKLGRTDICQWLSQEQNGYADSDPVPDYRQVSVMLCFNTNGYIPVGYGLVQKGVVPIPDYPCDYKVPIWQPVSTILAWIQDMASGNGIYMPLPPKVAEVLRGRLKSNRPEVFRHVTLMHRLDGSEARAIPEHIKNRVMDWACGLEAAGVQGDGQSFSDNEKTNAQTVNLNISHSTIDQLNHSGNNIKGA